MMIWCDLIKSYCLISGSISVGYVNELFLIKDFVNNLKDVYSLILLALLSLRRNVFVRLSLMESRATGRYGYKILKISQDLLTNQLQNLQLE
jgi:hypothetical protein